MFKVKARRTPVRSAATPTGADIRRRDPSLLGPLRREWSAAVRRMFATFRRAVVDLVVVQDVFGLRDEKTIIPVPLIFGANAEQRGGSNCGTGAGGFKAGNTCAVGGGGTTGTFKRRLPSGAGEFYTPSLEAAKTYGGSVHFVDVPKGVADGSKIDEREHHTAGKWDEHFIPLDYHKQSQELTGKLPPPVDGMIRMYRGSPKKFSLLGHVLRTNEALTTNRREWEFKTTEQKLVAFKTWIAQQLGRSLNGPAADRLWQDYIDRGHRRGVRRAFDEVRKAGGSFSTMGDLIREKQKFEGSVYSRPVTVEKVRALAARSLNDLDGVTGKMATRMSRILVDGLVERKRPVQIAAELSREVGIGEKEALRIVNTELSRAQAEGELDGLEEAGETHVGAAVEWETRAGACPLCAALKGIVLTIDEARGMLPRHPNAVFAGSTFIPYGQCEELVRAKYRGPAVVLESAGGEHRTTIGPNHPMFTRRGMVPAAQLRKGDEVLYDLRHDNLGVAGRQPSQVNNEQIPDIEDVFKACLTVCKDSYISSSGSDLHGDRVFCKGKVEAVAPAPGLLLVWDSLGIEKFRKLDLVGSDPDLQTAHSFGSSSFNLPRILLSAAGGMGSGSQLLAVLRSGLRHADGCALATATGGNPGLSKPVINYPATNLENLGQSENAFTVQEQFDDFVRGQVNPVFRWVKIHSTRLSTFEGYAFDATTATSLYCNSGFVVSNCKCSWKALPPKERGQVRTAPAIRSRIRKSARLGDDDFRTGAPVTKRRPDITDNVGTPLGGSSGGNCGTGAGGFKLGNTCAAGGGVAGDSAGIGGIAGDGSLGVKSVDAFREELPIDEYGQRSGTKVLGEVRVRAFRIGAVEDRANRGGVFFSGDTASIAPYASLHPGHSVKEYTVHLKNAILAGHQNDLAKLFFKKTYGELMDSIGARYIGKPAHERSAAFDRKILNEARKRGYDGIIYTAPAAPAITEVVVIGKGPWGNVVTTSITPTLGDLLQSLGK